MGLAKIRKIVTIVEDTHEEAGQIISPPTRRAAAIAVIENPFAGTYQDNLEMLMAIGEELGGLLGERCVAALGITPQQAQSYGKAILHPRLGKPLRAAVEKGAALVPSNKKRGGMGHPIDVPLGHKDAAYVRSHFDGMEVSVNDAPRTNEILVAIAVADSGRPLPRVGGLTHDEAEGKDGLR